MTMNNIIVGMGEALWDVLPEGKKIGGAPANFAYHVSQFGFDSRVVSAIGDDKLGNEILENFDSKKLNYLIEKIPYPTGTVQVELDPNGVPMYDIKEGVAWDNIPFTPALEELARNTRSVCFGSLARRIEILKVHARNVHLDETVDFENIALATSGAVGSDLANMINEAAILAVKSGRSAVSQKDLLEAVEVVLVGKEKKDRILSAQERRIVSYHEVGHALVSALQKDAEPVQKITIVPRTMGALGYVMQVPEEEKYLNTKKELEAMLVGYLGGRAAEELVFDTVTTGAANDIEQATKVARAMITQYGMSDKFGLMGLATQESQYLSGRAVLNCGDDTATEVDHEVMILLHNSYEEAKRLIGSHREALDKIATYLIRRETITGKEFMKIFHAVERGIEIPENLDDLVIPEEKQNTVTLDKPEIQ